MELDSIDCVFYSDGVLTAHRVHVLLRQHGGRRRRPYRAGSSSRPPPSVQSSPPTTAGVGLLVSPATGVHELQGTWSPELEEKESPPLRCTAVDSLKFWCELVHCVLTTIYRYSFIYDLASLFTH
jgi:hypothetical protein